ncbi:MAG: hypothetical protein WD824_21050 [Cyclobacteriaceae bacterium]
MREKKVKIVVKKTSFEEEQRMKEEAFVKLSPAERLKIHEQLRKRIWGPKYNKLSLKGLKVTKKPMPS